MPSKSDAMSATVARPYRLPTPLRVAVVVTVLSCAVAFVAMSGLMLASLSSSPAPHPVVDVGLALFVGALGGLFATVAWSFVQRSGGPHETGPIVRTIFGLLFAAAGIGQMTQAIVDASVSTGVLALGSAWCAFVVLRSTVAEPARHVRFGARVHAGLGASLCLGAFALAVEAFRAGRFGFAMQAIAAASLGALILRSPAGRTAPASEPR